MGYQFCAFCGGSKPWICVPKKQQFSYELWREILLPWILDPWMCNFSSIHEKICAHVNKAIHSNIVIFSLSQNCQLILKVWNNIIIITVHKSATVFWKWENFSDKRQLIWRWQFVVLSFSLFARNTSYLIFWWNLAGIKACNVLILVRWNINVLRTIVIALALGSSLLSSSLSTLTLLFTHPN